VRRVRMRARSVCFIVSCAYNFFLPRVTKKHLHIA
jgi:hypothetical protein